MPMDSAERRLATSVLVIGTGGSGLRAAIQLAELGAHVRRGYDVRADADARSAVDERF